MMSVNLVGDTYRKLFFLLIVWEKVLLGIAFPFPRLITLLFCYQKFQKKKKNIRDVSFLLETRFSGMYDS